MVDNTIQEILQKRWKKIYHPVMVVAHLLDPRYHGKSLDRNSVVVIEKFIRHYCPNDSTLIWEQLTQYKTRTGIFNIELAWSTVEKIDPIIWWKANFALLAPQLTQLALLILTIPCSSAASERNWSAFSYIHDKKRNRLTAARVLKLVYIYSNYKLRRPRQDSVEIEASVARMNARVNGNIITNQELNNEDIDPIEGNDNDNESEDGNNDDDESGSEDEDEDESDNDNEGEEDEDEGGYESDNDNKGEDEDEVGVEQSWDETETKTNVDTEESNEIYSD